MDKTLTPPSGDKHDYMSFGPYWWPDPSKKDGLPYIRRDGEVNPESRTGGSDNLSTRRLKSCVTSLALAWYFTDDEKYAKHAALMLRTWFLNPETKINPHLKYGQAIPGRVQGRGIGIIETAMFLDLTDAAILLQGSKSWTPEDHAALQAWFRQYLKWLLTSKHGKDESREPNNHGVWYDTQVAGFALFVGDEKTARRILTSAKKRILSQIDAKGRQEHELARTRSFTYSMFNLKGMFSLAAMADLIDIDLWSLKQGDKPALKAAVDFLAPYADPARKWPHKQITDRKPEALLHLLKMANLAYGTVVYNRFAAMVPAEERKNSLANLLYPDAR